MIIVWPDNSWCFPEELWEFDWKSDDYTRVEEKDFHNLDPCIQSELREYYYGRSE